MPQILYGHPLHINHRKSCKAMEPELSFASKVSRANVKQKEVMKAMEAELM